MNGTRAYLFFRPPLAARARAAGFFAPRVAGRTAVRAALAGREGADAVRRSAGFRATGRAFVVFEAAARAGRVGFGGGADRRAAAGVDGAS